MKRDALVNDKLVGFKFEMLKLPLTSVKYTLK